MMRTVVLASRSAARGRLLAAAGVSFLTDPADIDERAVSRADHPSAADPQEIALRLASAKSAVVSLRHSDAVVIGADQTLDLDGACLTKPETLHEAREQLAALRGRTHRLHSAVTCICREGVWRHVASATLSMRRFSDAFLDDYLEKCGARTLESVGAYHMEGHGIQLFDQVDGDFFTILGLPMLPLLERLRTTGVLIA